MMHEFLQNGFHFNTLSITHLPLAGTANPQVDRIELLLLQLDKESIESVRTYLNGARGVRSVKLGMSSLTAEGATALGELLRQFPKLESLEFSKSAMNAGTLDALMEGLGEHTGLTRMAFSHNALATEQGFQALDRAARKLPNFHTLALSGETMDEKASIALAGFLQENPRMRSFTGSLIDLPTPWMDRVLESLKHHPGLVSLFFGVEGETYATGFPAYLASRMADATAPNLFILHPRSEPASPICQHNSATAEACLSLLRQTPPEEWDYAMLGRLNLRLPGMESIARGKEEHLDILTRMLEALPLLPEAADVESLFAPDAGGYAPLDNPRIWRDPEAVMRVVDASGQPFSPELLARRTPRGVSFLESAVYGAAAKPLIDALLKRGIQLNNDILIRDGQPTEIFRHFLEQNAGLQLCREENWRGAGPAALPAVVQALPPEQRPLVAAHTLRMHACVSHAGPGR